MAIGNRLDGVKPKCPSCDALLDGYTPVEGEVHRHPKGGDMTFCVYCDTVLVFNDDLSLRYPSKAEMEEFLQYLGDI